MPAVQSRPAGREAPDGNRSPPRRAAAGRPTATGGRGAVGRGGARRPPRLHPRGCRDVYGPGRSGGGRRGGRGRSGRPSRRPAAPLGACREPRSGSGCREAGRGEARPAPGAGEGSGGFPVSGVPRGRGGRRGAEPARLEALPPLSRAGGPRGPASRRLVLVGGARSRGAVGRRGCRSLRRKERERCGPGRETFCGRGRDGGGQ